MSSQLALLVAMAMLCPVALLVAVTLPCCARRRLSLQDYSGTAGQQSGLALQGTRFSTRDADNDNCLCKCAQMLSGGERREGGRGTPIQHPWVPAWDATLPPSSQDGGSTPAASPT